MPARTFDLFHYSFNFNIFDELYFGNIIGSMAITMKMYSEYL